MDFIGKRLSSFQIIIAGFAAVILAGTLLLMLPVSACSGQWTSFEDALFTSTSAVCVTGLVVRDTGTWWSPFGQAVLLVLIQIGGLGIITVAAFITTASGRRLSLLQRSLLQDSISAHQIGGMVKMTSFIIKTVLFAEAAGALLMMPVFLRSFGAAGIWMAVFHSVSAFCNAGFDIMGPKSGLFSSLTLFSSSLGIVLPICLLIMVGGLGFLTWHDILKNKYHFRNYRMQTKAILVFTAILIILPAFFMYHFEFADQPLKERLCLSLFQAITPRTAGFNTADLNALSGTCRGIIIVLMLIGGSPGSTAGGFKTTTAVVLFANAAAVFRRKKSIRLFGRRVEDSVLRTASTVVLMYIVLVMTGAFVISTAEGLPTETCIFEAASAIGTVGLTLGITPSLGLISRLILICLMFFGRVGGLTVIYAALASKDVEVSQCPVEKINVG